MPLGLQLTRDADETLSEPGRERARSVLAPGQTIARYVVLGRLGAGGMGIVYRCHDPELDRSVAVKLLHPTMAGSQGASRGRDALLQEARALARLAHPNVVAVHDVGTRDDEVYLAMELVDGETLDAWIAARPRAWRDVVDVYAQAGRGLAAAHAVGVVHRDFKPANAMIGRDDRVRVMDFGLARANDRVDSDLDREAGTMTLRPAGTPAYMAPEQYLGGPTDAHSDQFSFCVALFEAFYGQRPFAGDTLAALAAAVTAGETVGPRVERGVPRWLKAVVMRGLAVDPAKRHDTMEALLEALQRGRVRARNRRLVAVTSSTLALAAVLVGARELERRNTAAACELEGERIAEVWNDDVRQKLRAAFERVDDDAGSDTFERTAPWLDRYASSWSAARTDLCVQARVDEAIDPVMHDEALACVEDRRAALEVSLEVLADGEPSTLTRAVHTVARLEPVDACMDERERAHWQSPSTHEQRVELAAVRRELARAAALQSAGRFADAEPAVRAAIARADALDWTPARAEAGVRLGKVLERVGDYDGAEEALVDAFFLAGNAGLDRAALEAAAGLVLVAGRRARFDDGLLWSRHGDLLLVRVGAEDGLESAALYNARATILLARGDEAAAIAELDRALAVTERELGQRHPEPATIHNNLGGAYLARGDLDSAAHHMEAARGIFEEVLGPQHPSVGMATLNLGNIAATRGEHPRAIEHFERALAIYRAAFGPDHPDVGAVLNSLGSVQRAQGANASALARYDEALVVREQALGPEHPDVAEVLANIGNVHVDLGEHDEGVTYFERALAILERAYPPDHREIAIAKMSMGNAQLHAGRMAPAAAALERALAIFDSNAERGVMAGLVRFLLAQALWETGDRTRALELATSSHAMNVDAELGAQADDVQDWIRRHPVE